MALYSLSTPCRSRTPSSRQRPRFQRFRKRRYGHSLRTSQICPCPTPEPVLISIKPAKVLSRDHLYRTAETRKNSEFAARYTKRLAETRKRKLDTKGSKHHSVLTLRKSILSNKHPELWSLRNRYFRVFDNFYAINRSSFTEQLNCLRDEMKFTWTKS